MAIYTSIDPAFDIKTSKSSLNQLVDVVQADVSGSTTRQSFEVFVTGGVGPGVTSSLFQTVYDQDYSLQTANAVLDMTMGLYFSGSTVTGSMVGEDANGKLLFSSQSLMMREKVNLYKQYAQLLLGNASNRFYSPPASTTVTDAIDNALFISFKRLFTRDTLRRETFAMKFFSTGTVITDPAGGGTTAESNVDRTADSGDGAAVIITDIGANNSLQKTVYGGDVGKLVDSTNTDNNLGLIYYDEGIVVLNLDKTISGSQYVSGAIDAMSVVGTIDAATIPAGKTVIGSSAGNPNAKFIPDFLVSGSIDDVVNHFASCRFGNGSALTAMTFQNQTAINSTLVYCRAPASDFNYSSNPTFTDSSNNIVVVDPTDATQRSFTFATSVGLYDTNNNLLAVAKLSRPVEKNDEKDITFRVRLDF
jgi:hypothetical protein